VNEEGDAIMQGEVGRICFARLLEGEDLAGAIKKRAEENGIKAGIFNVIGTLKEATLGFYKESQYYNVRVDGPLEIASCMGNVGVDVKGEVLIHAHLVVSNENCEAFGGHLMKDSHVGAAAELVIIEASGVNLQKTFDPKTKLNLWKLG
jgi:predicted DNA-binding protein with PD1-like motif